MELDFDATEIIVNPLESKDDYKMAQLQHQLIEKEKEFLEKNKLAEVKFNKSGTIKKPYDTSKRLSKSKAKLSVAEQKLIQTGEKVGISKPDPQVLNIQRIKP